MTVAAVILAASPASALADADGLPRVRRLADAAWSGGAVPVVVVSHDPDGAIAVALAGTSVTLAEPAPVERGPVGQIVHGIEVAARVVRETSAALVWPVRMTWVDPETVTSLVESHGTEPDAVLRPGYAGEPGWPAVVPLEITDKLRALDPGRMPGELLDDLAAAGARVRVLELGDPGSVVDGDTPRSQLPPYQGPPEPPGTHTHEWGAAVADQPEDALGPAPSVVPYEPMDEA